MFSMGKVLCIVAMALSALLLLVFLLDLTIGVPFQRAALIMDIIFLIASGTVGTLSFFNLRQIR